MNTLRFLVLLLVLPPAMLRPQPVLQIHGYLSQAYAQSSDYPIFGIPVSGTTDYRNLALQFRANANDKTSLIFQFSHKRLGKSPIMLLEEDVELDWGFFEYRFSENGYLRAGLLQLPFGIYNEIRDVGVLLPFYQVPNTPYGEGNYTSETVNGLSAGYTAHLGENWALSGDVYGGEWTWTEWFMVRLPISPNTVSVLVAEPGIKKALGGQVWLETPISEVRFGAGGFYGEVSGGISFGIIGASTIRSANFSVDCDFEKYLLRSEATFFSIGSGLRANSQYLQVGYRPLDWLRFVSQLGRNRARNIPLIGDIGRTLDSPDLTFFEEVAVSLNLLLRADFVVKLENHWTSGFLTEAAPANLGVYLETRKTNYAIISVSTSF